MATDLEKELLARLSNLEKVVQAATPGLRCTAASPHHGKLVFQRGDNVYHCECGKQYRKDGKGGLQEV